MTSGAGPRHPWWDRRSCRYRALPGLCDFAHFAPNRASDQHPWFVESRSSRENPKRDWYIWHDAGLGGALPNNWISDFGGSAWEWDAATGQYCLHAFLKQQPDLNRRNPGVRAAMADALGFWLDRGYRSSCEGEAPCRQSTRRRAIPVLDRGAFRHNSARAGRGSRRHKRAIRATA